MPIELVAIAAADMRFIYYITPCSIMNSICIPLNACLSLESQMLMSGDIREDWCLCVGDDGILITLLLRPMIVNEFGRSFPLAIIAFIPMRECDLRTYCPDRMFLISWL